MKNEQSQFTVEYQDHYGVVYYRNVKAANIAEANMIIRQKQPDVIIRAVTLVPIDEKTDRDD
ncbi:hypothetical protein [Bacillus sp. FJAT-26390]|uniref:hypothetical protein n=1 Tax=Bacillus sp. FJAT-26390 TaxID=1743142 RepID=UPI000808155D|nr:hypothetical protein [Bacillus sp. FJAT-26390]OBZ17230.1 hypothetical protein A7975_04930 [Bacillus sp. FJAT-26390]